MNISKRLKFYMAWVCVAVPPLVLATDVLAKFQVDWTFWLGGLVFSLGVIVLAYFEPNESKIEKSIDTT